MGRSFNLIKKKINTVNSSSYSNYSNPSSKSNDHGSSSAVGSNDKYREVLQIVKKKGPPLTPKQVIVNAFIRSS